MMKIRLRQYQQTDADIICSWVKTEEELYRWSADRIGVFPVPENRLNEIYANVPEDTEFVPVTAVDEDGKPAGHLFIRILPGKPVKTARFGFVIVDPERRNTGIGEQMLLQAAMYAQNVLQAKTASLGVFTDNLPARKCYEKAGFRIAGRPFWMAPPSGEGLFYRMEERDAPPAARRDPGLQV